VRIAAATRGNPFYALEVAREQTRASATLDATLPVPDEVSALVAARVRRLPRSTRDALLVAAALPNPRLALLDRPALDPAVKAGLIEVGSTDVAFAHPLFAAAVYGSASMHERRELHRRLAPLVDDPEERARHLAFGSEDPSEEIARELEIAADRSVARGAPDAAAELLELAVRMTPADSGQRPVRELLAAECHFHAGDHTRARSLCEQVLAGTPARLVHGRALQLLGEIRYHDSSFREAIPLFEEALTFLEDDPRAVELHVNLSFAHYNLSDLAAGARHGHLASAGANGLGAGADGLQAAALAISTMADFYLDEPFDRVRIETALALEDPEQHVVMAMRPSLVAGVLALFSDELERAATLFEALRERTLDLGEESSLPHLDVDLSMLERTRGNLRRALELSEEAHETARMLGSATAQALALAELSYVRATLGDVDAARRDAERARATARAADIGYAFGWARSAVAFLDLSIGDPRGTSDALEPLLSDIERSGRCNPMSVTFGLPDGIEALVALGELGRAEALTALLEHHGRRHDRASALARAARCRALLAAARGERAAAEAEIERALVNHARVQMPLELGRTLLAKGQIERRGKQKRAARDSFQAGLERFDAIGARLWAQRARAELERTGAQHSEGDALTPTELRIAELAATGLTNKRIADTAFVSAKTVEANLARVYLKLGIHSRAELGRAMAERAGSSSAR
jgi:DNA-binding CsgD family transcriptional regulator